MGRKGNSGYTNPDVRFGSGKVGYSGSLGLTQHYLERLDGDLDPAAGPSLNNLVVWTRADTLVTFDGNGKVDTWGDQSGNNNNWGPTSTSNNYGPPDFDASNTAVNNLPTLEFFSRDRMDMAYSSELNVSSFGFCVYIVAKANSYPSSWSFLINHTSDGSWEDGWGIYRQNSDSALRFWVEDWNTGGQRANISTSGISFGNANIYKMHYDNSTITAALIGPDADSDTQNYSGNANVPSSVGPQLNGGRGAGLSYTGNWDIAEVVYYNRPITADEQTQTEDYLKGRYGFT